MLNGTVGSNPTLSAKKENKHYVWRSTQVAQEDPEGFYEVIGVALVFSIIAIIGMWKKDLF